MLPALWLCADLDHPDADSLTARVVDVCAAVDALVWLRSPHGMPASTVLRAAESLRAATPHTVLLVGDRLDVARAVDADGAHLSERSILPRDARSFGMRTISRAVHDREGIARHAPHVDALVLSPFGAVDHKGPPLGVDGFAALRDTAPARFVVALGGITDVDVARAARLAGADAIAVRRGLFARDPAAICAALRDAFTTPPRR